MPLGANKAAIMGVAGVSTADVVLLASQTASADASIEFTSNITSTYGEYIFHFYYIHPASDDASWTFNGSIDGGSNYNVDKTNTHFVAIHYEDDATTNLSYETSLDIVDDSGYTNMANLTSNDNDMAVSGELHLFNPASTTYVKHFYSRTVSMYSESVSQNNTLASGYFNTTSAINALDFKFSTGNTDAGIIKMWGVK